MIVVGCALIYGTLAWLDYYTRHNEAVIVPDVKGLSMNEAKSFFDNTGLRYNVIDSVFSNDVNPGAIVEVVPEPGSKVKEGRGRFVVPAGVCFAPVVGVQEYRSEICPGRL